MRFTVFAAAVALSLSAFSAQASTAAPAAQSNVKQGGRVVFVCDRTSETRRSFEREHGPMTFVTAEELAKAQAAGESWAAPRCISSAELQRYEINATNPTMMRARGDRPAR